ncbi:hypothetical protein T492DRAFT_851507, partial [Pavlovales sp. CCMP2436]
AREFTIALLLSGPGGGGGGGGGGRGSMWPCLFSGERCLKKRPFPPSDKLDPPPYCVAGYNVAVSAFRRALLEEGADDTFMQALPQGGGGGSGIGAGAVGGSASGGGSGGNGGGSGD